MWNVLFMIDEEMAKFEEHVKGRRGKNETVSRLQLKRPVPTGALVSSRLREAGHTM